MNDDLNHALGLENEANEQTQYFNSTGGNESPEMPEYDNDDDDLYSNVGDNIAEKVLAIVAYIFLILGILLSLIFGFKIISDPWGSGLAGFLTIVGGSIVSLICWAAMMITVNISNNIRQVKRLLQRRR